MVSETLLGGACGKTKTTEIKTIRASYTVTLVQAWAVQILSFCLKFTTAALLRKYYCTIHRTLNEAINLVDLLWVCLLWQVNQKERTPARPSFHSRSQTLPTCFNPTFYTHTHTYIKNKINGNASDWWVSMYRKIVHIIICKNIKQHYHHHYQHSFILHPLAGACFLPPEYKRSRRTTHKQTLANKTVPRGLVERNVKKIK